MPQIKQEGLEALEDFLQQELGNYSQFNYEIEVEDKEENIFTVTVLNADKVTKTYIRFQYTEGPDNLNIYGNLKRLYVDLGEDCWEETDNWSNNVKYFWQALLWR